MENIRLNIEKKTLENNNYRKVINTTRDSQLVLMSLLPKQDIGSEKHNVTQFIKVEGGNGTAIINERKYILKDGVSVMIPPNVKHNIIGGNEGLKLYTLYSPPHHSKGLIERIKK